MESVKRGKLPLRFLAREQIFEHFQAQIIRVTRVEWIP